jgi:dihydroorotate dehydrogenase electron transfer subunit
LPQTKKYAHPSVGILANEQVAENHYVMTLGDPAMAEEVQPGQFFEVRLQGPSAPFLPRPFSLFDWHFDEDGRRAGFKVLYKLMGVGTAALSKLKPGDTVAVTGPLGNTFSAPDAAKSIMIIAGGIGIAPFLSFIRRAIAAGVQASRFHLLYGARTASLIVEENPFVDLGVEMEVATDDGSRGVKGTVMDLLSRHCSLLAPEDIRVYSSGPTPMLNVLAQFCVAQRIKCELSLEARMICGIGVCNSCAVAVKSDKAPDGWEYKLVCRDGPVFDAAALHF